MWRLTRGRYRLQPPWTDCLCLDPWAGRACSLCPLPERCWSSSRRQISPPLKRTHAHIPSSLNAVTQHGPKLDLCVDPDGLSVAEAQTEANVLSHIYPNFQVCDYYYLQGRIILSLLLSKSFHHTRERVLCAFTWTLRCASDGQDAFFSVEDFPECFGYFAALQLMDYLEETTANTQITNSCLKSYEKLTALAK